jgi:hypothetical protein
MPGLVAGSTRDQAAECMLGLVADCIAGLAAACTWVPAVAYTRGHHPTTDIRGPGVRASLACWVSAG